MMLLTLLFYTSFLLYVSFGIYVLRINKNSPINRTFFFLCLSLSLWALGSAMMNSSDSSWIIFSWLLVSTFGWCAFPGILINFVLPLTSTPVNRLYRLLLLLPGFLFFLHYLTLPLENLLKTPYGWVYLYETSSIWEILFNTFDLFYFIAILLLLFNWKIKAAAVREKKQANIIFATTLITTILGVFTDIILPMFWGDVVPVAILICPIAVIGIGYSILKYKMLKATLEIESKYILKTMSDPVLYLNKDLIIIEVNKALLNISGYFEEELINRPAVFLFRRGIDIEKCLNDSESQSIENSLFSTDSREINCLISATAVIDATGGCSGFVCLLHDITEKKKIIDELELRVNERTAALLEAEQKETQLLKETLELKDNFITLITHEFKTPIAIINAALQTMEVVCGGELSSKSRKYLNKIKQNSFRQERLVENLLDITRLKAGMIKVNYENTDIVLLTKEIIDSVKVFARHKDIKVQFLSTLEYELIMTDTEKYERILLNLLSNAIKFSPPNKTIKVKLSQEGSFIKLEVIDRGIGIPQDRQNSIFEKFEQINSSLSRQAEGTGIGLYLVKSFTEALGGTISLISKEGCGAAFTVLLPIREERSDQNKIISKDAIDIAVSLELSDIIH